MGPRTYLVHGLLAGLVAGLVAFGVASVLGGPSIEAAIALEGGGAAHDHGEAHAADEDHAHEAGAAPVSRAVQSTWGLLLGTTVLGTAMGALTGLAAAALAGRLGVLRPAGTAAVATLLAGLALWAVPAAAYPPLPPGAGDGGTVGTRTAAWFGLVGVAAVAGGLAVVVARRVLARPVGAMPGGLPRTWCAIVAGALAFLATTATAVVLAPAASSVDGLPAALVWEFRAAAVATQLSLWLTLGTVLTGLVGRRWQQVEADQQRLAFAASL